jgi:cytochrome c2
MKPRLSLLVPCLALLAAFLSAALADAPAPSGEKLFTDRGCFVCHTVGEPSKGLGPELTQVAYQRDPAWLRAWLSDPQKIKKGTVMPKVAWKSPTEMDYVVSLVKHK